MAVFVRTQQVEHSIGLEGRFALRVTSPDVEIHGTNEHVARVRVTIEIRAGSDAEADEILQQSGFQVTAGEGSLEVIEPRHSEKGLDALARIFGGGKASSVEAVQVEVPRSAHVEYEGVSADVTATDLVGPQRFQTVSGDLFLDRVAGSLRLQGVSGDVSVRAAAPISLDASTVSGDLSAFAPVFETLRVGTVSGDVELEGELGIRTPHRIETVSGDLSLGVTGPLTLEVRGLSTDVDINVPHRAEGSRDRRRYIVGEGGAQVLFSSMSGDISLGSARRGSSPIPPIPPIPPTPPVPPVPPIPPVAPTHPRAALDPEAQLAVLQALERGEIDVDEAARRLAGGDSDV